MGIIEKKKKKKKLHTWVARIDRQLIRVRI